MSKKYFDYKHKTDFSIPHLQWLVWKNFKDVERIYYHLRIMFHKQHLKNQKKNKGFLTRKQRRQLLKSVNEKRNKYSPMQHLQSFLKFVLCTNFFLRETISHILTQQASSLLLALNSPSLKIYIIINKIKIKGDLLHSEHCI